MKTKESTGHVRGRATAPRRRWVGILASGGLVAGLALTSTAPALAAVDVDAPVLINEVYGGGGNGGAYYTHDFIELVNPGTENVSLDGWSVQYASANGDTWTNRTNLSGTIPAGETYLIQQAAGTGGTQALPTPDLVGTIALGAASGKVALVSSIANLDCARDCTGHADVVDFVGYGEATDYAGSGPTGVLSATRSATRTDAVHTADNSADFTVGEPTPQPSGFVPEIPEPAEPMTIAEIREGLSSGDLVTNQEVTTTGWVTASYPTGGFNGFVIQTEGTGGECVLDTPSDAVFVYAGAGAGSPVSIGEYVEVTGNLGDYQGLTQITNPEIEQQATAEVPPAAAVECPWPATDAERSALESMLYLPTGDLTVTNTYTTHQFGEVGLATGTTPLLQPTDQAPYGSAAHDRIVADNAARGVVLDDGASTNFASGVRTLVPPYVTVDGNVRVGAATEFVDPVILDYRNNLWKLNPTAALGADDPAPVTFEQTRTAGPDAAALGAADLKVASFNVLNYFTTTGDTWAGGCSSYNDRNGDPVTVNTCNGTGPRGAWDAANLQRQQDKIVAAINALDADVVGLLEIENSAVVDGTPDEAVATLVAALNAEAGAGVWAYVPSSTDLPSPSQMDVISNAIIYQTASVDLVGTARALGTQSGTGGTFENAREPIGQAFVPADGGAEFFVAVNHFKSKSGSGGGEEADLGQGAWNALRTRQANALTTWVQDTALPAIESETGVTVSDVFLMGDFNAYGQEDPMLALYASGYTNVNRGAEKYSYSYSGLSGSLDHIVANESARQRLTGYDIWNINSPESIALEYSRYRATAGDFYAPDAYRSSDHDPIVAGITAGAQQKLNILNINDFHGRIDENTVAFAGTIEQLRADAGESNTLFTSAGDNIGASLFASAIQQDEPTIDVLNVLELQASAVGNHEFDQGWSDLRDRVVPALDAPYLGANVYAEGTTTPVLPEYELFDYGDLTVGVIGAVTQETPTLVSPAGIAGLEFGDPVEAVNRVAAQLTDGNPANGEADVLIAQYHDGASDGTPQGATLEQEVAAGGTFGSIVTETSAAVDVIFTGHTHKEYVWDGPVPGATDGSTRPIVQTGNYGENIGQVELGLDAATGDVWSYQARNVPRLQANLPANQPAMDADLIATYPRVAAVDQIVTDALAHADVEGNTVIGEVTADITTSFGGGSFVDGIWTGGTRDNRAEASTLGTLVGNAVLESMAALPDAPQIGVGNSGGLRSELFYAPNGEITVAEARSVLPFNNEMSIAFLTGEQIVTLLEQQWQRDADGNVPSRPYLQLGFSDNVTYTYDEIPDPEAPGTQKGVIGSVTIDGVPIDPEAEYRVGTTSFMAAGGDNFRVFTDARRTVNTGLLDYQSWIEYLTASSPISPDFARQGVQVSGLSTDLEAGTPTQFTVSRADLHSLGAPRNTELIATIDGVEVGRADFTAESDAVGGTADVTVTVPATVSGPRLLTLRAEPSGTQVQIPVEVTGGSAAVPVLELSSTRVAAGDDLTITVRGAPAEGSARIMLHSTPTELGTVAFDADGVGTATVTIPADTAIGVHTVQVVGDGIDVSAALTVTAPAPGGPGGSDPGAGGQGTDPGGDLATTGVWLIPALLAAFAAILVGVVAYRRRTNLG